MVTYDAYAQWSGFSPTPQWPGEPYITMVTIVTMGGGLQPGCLADRLLTGLSQSQINPSGGVKFFLPFFFRGGKIIFTFDKKFAVTRKIPKKFSHEEKYFRHMPETGWDRLSVFFFVWDLPPKKLETGPTCSHWS